MFIYPRLLSYDDGYLEKCYVLHVVVDALFICNITTYLLTQWTWFLMLITEVQMMGSSQ